MKVYNDNQLYQSPAGDQLRNSGRQNWIFGRIGDQEGAILDPGYISKSYTTSKNTIDRQYTERGQL